MSGDQDDWRNCFCQRRIEARRRSIRRGHACTVGRVVAAQLIAHDSLITRRREGNWEPGRRGWGETRKSQTLARPAFT